MENTEVTTISTHTPHAAVKGLAIVGFITLIIVGIALGVYSARFVPGVVSRVGGAAVYLGSVFTPAPAPGLTVVPSPTASTTISFGTASTTSAASATSTTPAPQPQTTAGGTQTTTTYVVGTTTVQTTVTPHGLPDLSVKITAIGYLATASTDSFVESGSVPAGSRPAIKFTVTNVGTNWSGVWHLSVSIPMRTGGVNYRQFDAQPSLAPLGMSGDAIDYTLGFDQATTGIGQTASVTVNFDNIALDSNQNNNTATVQLNIL